MADIIKHWVVKKLGLPVSFNRGGDRLRQELSNGHLIGEILRKYHHISDDMLMTIVDSVCHHDREKNMNVLYHWLQGMSFEVEMSELNEIRLGKPGAALSFLYRMYLWLEGPGSQPGLHPREKQQSPIPSRGSTAEARENWISYVTDRYTEEQAAGKVGLTYEEFLKEQNETIIPKKDSLVVNVASKMDLEKREGENETIPLEDAESFPELKSTDFLDSLKESLAYKGEASGEKPKLVVSLSSVLPQDNRQDIQELKPSTSDEQRKVSPAETYPSYDDSSFRDREMEPYIEVDDRGLDALECGQLPSFYIRNYPYGNTNEKLQAGNLYFHSKAMMVLQEQKLSAIREFNPRVQSRKLCQTQPYVGAYEEALMNRNERKRKRDLIALENTLSEMNNFDEKLQNSNKDCICQDFPVKIYPNGRGNWTDASSRINALKNRRRKDKIRFQKRCSMRKILAVGLAKSSIHETHKELDETIHSKLLVKSKQEILLAEYCIASHLEKSAFVEHIKLEQKQYLDMAIIQNYTEYLHTEQLDIIKNKVDKITEECNEQIMNEVQAMKQKAQFIMDIKFCEEIFVAIVKAAIQFSDYRSEYGSDPPAALVAEWQEAFYLGSCVTMVKHHVKKESKSKVKPDKYSQEHANRCKKKKREKKEKAAALKAGTKKSKASNTSLKSKSSHNYLERPLSTIVEDIEEEELPMNHEDRHKKRKVSGKKMKHKDLLKTNSNESKNSHHSGVDFKKSTSYIIDADADVKSPKDTKKQQKESNSKTMKEKKKSSLKDPSKEQNSNSKTEEETAVKVKKGQRVSPNDDDADETKRDSKDVTEEKATEENAGKKKREIEKTSKAKKLSKAVATKGKGNKKERKGQAPEEEELKTADADNEEEEQKELPEEPGPEKGKEKKSKKSAAKTTAAKPAVTKSKKAKKNN